MTVIRTWLCAVGTILLTASSVVADQLMSTGVIQFIDHLNREFRLANGQIFAAGPKIRLSARKIGDEVTVRYELRSDTMLAVDVRRVPYANRALVPLPVRKPAD